MRKNKGKAKLTLRQKDFLGRLMELYQEIQEPMHYRVVARQFGLSDSATYDMLRLLEQKGLVNSAYAVPKGSSGPGRPNILFFPSIEATALYKPTEGNSRGEQEWQEVKARILDKLSRGKESEHQVLIQELAAKMSEQCSPLVRCAEVITTLMLKFKETEDGLTVSEHISKLLKVPADKLRMSRLAGLITGLSLTSKKQRSISIDYESYLRKYEAGLQKLGRESMEALHQFTRDVWYAMNAVPQE